MNNIIRNCIYQAKNSFRDLGFLFWSLAYPLILAAFFYAAFSGMMNQEIGNINVGVEDGSQISYVLDQIDFLNVNGISEEKIEEKLNNREIDGFIDEDLNLTVNKSGLNQTIIKEIVEQIKQTYELNRPIDGSEFSTDYILDRDQNSNPVVVIFYSLIAMVSAYGIFAGIEIPSFIQANLSNVGNRINATPLKKSNFLLAGVIVGLILNLFSNVLLISFINFVLKLELFNEIKYSAIFIVIGNLFGICLGIFIGVSNKKSINTKTMIGIAITLFLSFLSGMMGPWIKIVIDKNIPILGRINPISIISNNLYRINILNSTKSVVEGILVLSFYCIILVFISYVLLRRKNYDSI